MLKRLFFLFFILGNSVIYSQKYFYLNSRSDTIPVIVNGTIFKIGEEFQKIRTNYPRLDTIQFQDHAWKDSSCILCNFKPDTSYSLFFNCCGTIDINPSSKWNNDSLGLWDYETEFEKYQKVLMDLPYITLSISNGSEKDSIYGWYVDYACFPRFKILNKKGWNYGQPNKCFYWNNISPFLFFQSKENYDPYKDGNGIINDVYPADYYELARVYVRLFDNEKHRINYDVKTKKITVR